MATPAFVDSIAELQADARQIAYADFGRSNVRSARVVMDQAAAYASAQFPSAGISARLGWDYPDSRALTELNGARVRLNAAVDDLPEGDVMIPTAEQIALTNALLAAYDLCLKIWDRGTMAPTAAERVTAGAGAAATTAGNLLGGTVADFLNAMFTNLWFWLAAAGAVVFFVYVRPMGALAPGVT